MKKSFAIGLLGPDDTVHGLIHDHRYRRAMDFVLCAAVDPHQSEPMVKVGSMSVYNDLCLALRCTKASTILYDESYIDVNGCAPIRRFQALEPVL